MKRLLLMSCLLFPIQYASAEDAAVAPAADAFAGGFSGKVAETTNTAGYTYVLVDTGSKKLWAATTQFAVNVGDPVTVAAGVPMTAYHSKSLNRDFDVVYFTGGITVNGGNSKTSAPTLPPGHPSLTGGSAPVLPPGHPALTGSTASPEVVLTGIERAKGGKTVQEIITGSSKLAGKSVTVRGKIVKYNSMILGKNWLHIQDGSGSAGKNDNDLAITSTTPAQLGDTVLVAGNVSTNIDFGGGYKYTVIIQDANVTVE